MTSPIRQIWDYIRDHGDDQNLHPDALAIFKDLRIVFGTGEPPDIADHLPAYIENIEMVVPAGTDQDARLDNEFDLVFRILGFDCDPDDVESLMNRVHTVEAGTEDQLHRRMALKTRTKEEPNAQRQ